jgi:hypothetical protein
MPSQGRIPRHGAVLLTDSFTLMEGLDRRTQRPEPGTLASIEPVSNVAPEVLEVYR